jgi:putative peptidoglycan lipid II flippase
VGGAAALYYAERLLEFPLGLTGAALGMASLPALAASAGAGDTEKTGKEATYALRLAFCISLPAAAGLAAVAEPLVRLCFFHGAFDAGALAAASAALAAYAPALPAWAASRPLLALANAEKRTRLTTVSACIAVPLAALTGFFLLPAGIIGPPLGFGIGIWAQFFTLRFSLRRYAPPLPSVALFRYGTGSALVFAAARLILTLLPDSPAALLPAVALPAALYVVWLLLSGDDDVSRLLKRRPRKSA